MMFILELKFARLYKIKAVYQTKIWQFDPIIFTIPASTDIKYRNTVYVTIEPYQPV